MRILIVILLLLFCTTLYAQSTVSGVVFDGFTNQPLKEVQVTAVPGKIAAFTMTDGKFSINSPNHIDSIFISYQGYKSIQVPATGRELVIALSPSFVNLNEVIVSGNREIQRRKEFPAAVQVISPAMIN